MPATFLHMFRLSFFLIPFLDPGNSTESPTSKRTLCFNNDLHEFAIEYIWKSWVYVRCLPVFHSCVLSPAAFPYLRGHSKTDPWRIATRYFKVRHIPNAIIHELSGCVCELVKWIKERKHTFYSVPTILLISFDCHIRITKALLNELIHARILRWSKHAFLWVHSRPDHSEIERKTWGPSMWMWKCITHWMWNGRNAWIPCATERLHNASVILMSAWHGGTRKHTSNGVSKKRPSNPS